MKKSNKLTYKQLLCLEAIEIFIEKNKYAPTIKELSEMLGTKYHNSVAKLLIELEEKGYIETSRYKARTIRIIRGTNENIN